MKCDNYCDHYDALKADNERLRGLLREASMMCREATDLMIGDDGGFVPGGWHEFRDRIDAALAGKETDNG